MCLQSLIPSTSEIRTTPLSNGLKIRSGLEAAALDNIQLRNADLWLIPVLGRLDLGIASALFEVVSVVLRDDLYRRSIFPKSPKAMRTPRPTLSWQPKSGWSWPRRRIGFVFLRDARGLASRETNRAPLRQVWMLSLNPAGVLGEQRRHS